MNPFEIIEKIKNDYLDFALYNYHYRHIENSKESDLNKKLQSFENDFMKRYWYLRSIHEYYDLLNSHDPTEPKKEVKDQILIFDNKRKCAFYLDIHFMLWLEIDIKKDIWAFIESHPKPTGEIFYSLGMEIMKEHDYFLEQVESYKNNSHSTYSLPVTEFYSESMERRSLAVKSFVFTLTNYSLDLKKELTFTEKEIIKFKDLKNTLNSELPKIKQSHKLWNVYTRYELLKNKFPAIIDTLDKISPASNRNKLLAQIMGINEDTAKSLFNGNYKHDKKESELKDMNDFLNKLNKSE